MTGLVGSIFRLLKSRTIRNFIRLVLEHVRSGVKRTVDEEIHIKFAKYCSVCGSEKSTIEISIKRIMRFGCQMTNLMVFGKMVSLKRMSFGSKKDIRIILLHIYSESGSYEVVGAGKGLTSIPNTR